MLLEIEGRSMCIYIYCLGTPFNKLVEVIQCILGPLARFGFTLLFLPPVIVLPRIYSERPFNREEITTNKYPYLTALVKFWSRPAIFCVTIGNSFVLFFNVTSPLNPFDMLLHSVNIWA